VVNAIDLVVLNMVAFENFKKVALVEISIDPSCSQTIINTFLKIEAFKSPRPPTTYHINGPY